jgi:hypothetical protein
MPQVAVELAVKLPPVLQHLEAARHALLCADGAGMALGGVSGNIACSRMVKSMLSGL